MCTSDCLKWNNWQIVLALQRKRTNSQSRKRGYVTTICLILSNFFSFPSISINLLYPLILLRVLQTWGLSQHALSKRWGTPFININIKRRPTIFLGFMFLPYSIYFNTQICTLCLIKSEAKYDLAPKQKSVHFSQQKWGVRMCSTFLIPKTFQASLTTKTSQLAAVNGLSPSARYRAFSWLKLTLQSPCWSRQSLRQTIMGKVSCFMWCLMCWVVRFIVHFSGGSESKWLVLLLDLRQFLNNNSEKYVNMLPMLTWRLL